MSIARLKSAVIGCGAIAHQHVRFLTQSPRAELVGMADQSLALARFFASHYGAGQAFGNAAELLAEPVDVVHVLTPPGTHGPLVRMALDAGCHVICEKPMCGSIAETRALLNYATAKERVLVESNNAIWNDNVVALRNLVASGALGEIREAEISIALDVASGPFGDRNLGDQGVDLVAGAVHDFLPHMCGLFLALTSATRIDSVTGRLSNLGGNPRVKFDYLDCMVTAGEVRGILRFAPDIKPATFRIAVRGTKGSAETDHYNPYLRVTSSRYEGKLAPLELIGAGPRMIGAGLRNLYNKIGGVTPYHGLDRMLDEVYVALATGKPSPVTPDYMLAVAGLVELVANLASPLNQRGAGNRTVG